MSRFATALLPVGLSLFLLTGAATASNDDNSVDAGSDQDSSLFSAGWDVTFASKYIWQGFDFSDGGPVIQPEAYVGIGDFSLILWVNHDINTDKTDEYDWIFQYDKTINKLSLSLGYIYYEYPRNPPQRNDFPFKTEELFLSLYYDHPINPSVTVNWDFEEGDGFYTTLGISHGFDIIGGNLSFATNLYVHGNYFELSGIPSAEFNATYEFAVGPVTISPGFSYFWAWENNEYKDHDGNFENQNAVSDELLFTVNVKQDF